jgi:hypothetical protein
MRATLVIAALLWLALASLGFAEGPRPDYTTLVVEFVGEMDRPVFPIVISTSLEEGEWYRQNLFPEPTRLFANVDIVSASTIREITELPLLRRGLENAKPTDDEEPKSTPTVRFIAGVGQDHAQIMLDAETSMKILLGIDKHVAKYPMLQSQIQEVENCIKGAKKRHR